MAQRQSYAPGATIFREGEPGDCAYVIERGEVEITALKGGAPFRLALLHKGDVLGEMALIDDELRSATATALEPTEVAVIDRQYFRERCDRADPIINVFLRVVLERFRETHRVRLGGEQAASIPPPARQSRTDIELEQDRQEALYNLKLEHALERALEQQELRLHYQPIVEVESGRVVGFEALMRWQHPERGLLPPADFIGFAEQTGLILPMGLWALGEAPLVLKRFQHTCDRVAPGRPPLYMAVNVSTGQLATLHDVDAILSALSRSGIDMRSVKLEITETVLMADPEQAARSLARLKEAGLMIAIDDFGTGYSSLGYLNRFPLDTVKLDQSFVASMVSSPASMKIVRSIAHLAHELDMSMIAEGIETPQQRRELEALDCDCAQGYLFARPAPADRIDAMLANSIELPPRGGAPPPQGGAPEG